MKNLNKIPLFNELCFVYTSGICHKEFFLFLNPKKCEVDVFSHDLKKITSITTEKYKSITENKEDCYFILTKENDKECLYKATYDFLEFDSIQLQIPNKYKEPINDIHYKEEEKQIIIVTNNFVYAITLEGYFIKELVKSSTLNNSIIIQNLNGSCRRNCIQPKSIFQYTAVGFCNNIYITYTEKENTFLAILSESNCLTDPICLGKNIKIVSIFICCGKMYLLVIKNNQYNYLFETDINCEKCCHKKCSSCIHVNPLCYEKCLCKHQNKCYHCQNCSCEHQNECHHCQNCSCEHQNECHHCQTCCEDPSACLLESIALIETSLSHILNAEGEKIQKAIADNANICQLLEINNSVTDSIFNVTMLELVLQKKMEKTLQYDKCHNKCK